MNKHSSTPTGSAHPGTQGAPCFARPHLWRYALLLGTAWMLGACAGVTPWVKPYERQNLATPAMAWSRDGLSDGYMHHVFQARESARGAEGGSGGGCGCN